MPDHEITLLKGPARTPWNKGKLIGAKPPLFDARGHRSVLYCAHSQGPSAARR